MSDDFEASPCLGGSDAERQGLVYSGSYQNCRADNGEDRRGNHVEEKQAGEEAGHSLFFGGGKRRYWVLAAALAAALVVYGVTQPNISDELYASMLKEYAGGSTPPLLGRSRSYARAQDLAESAREVSLGSAFPEDSHHHKKKRDEDEDGNGPPVGCEGTVLLLRHCEKQHNYEHCAYTGYERSVYLPTLFGKGHERWPSPSYIFALNPGERNTEWKKNYREVETILPLAEKANVTIDAQFGSEETSKLAKHIHGMLKSGEMCGKLTVVSWKHEDLPKLAHRLGCGPVEGCPLDYHGGTFDEVWQIKFANLIPRHATTKHEAKHDLKPKKPKWWVFGSLQREGFDPLAYSKLAGDYPVGGTKSGGRWRPDFKDEMLNDLRHDKLQFPSPAK